MPEHATKLDLDSVAERLAAAESLLTALVGNVSSLTNTIGNATTGLTAIGTKASTAISTATTALAQANLRVLKAGDTDVGPLMLQAPSTAPAGAVRLDQTYGGLNSPLRYISGVGATAVAMLPGPLTDPTPQNRRAKPLAVFYTMRTAPTLGVSITLKIGTTPGASNVWSKSIFLTALPGLLDPLGPLPPAFAELAPGTTLYAQVVNNLGGNGGTWDIELLSYYR